MRHSSFVQPSKPACHNEVKSAQNNLPLSRDHVKPLDHTAILAYYL